MTAPISLAAYRAARQAPAEPLDPEPAAILASLELDWRRACAAAPDATTARLWWLSQVLDDLAENEDPGAGARIMSQVALDEVMKRVTGKAKR